ncbi:hypothetical protein APHAL10511_004597 [Amanita phalloides]|nr:hypothetical protein APHAL10511_004597 [Amanita phalloides]
MSHTSSPAISASRFSSPGLSTTSASPAPYLTGTPSPVTNGTSAKAKAKAVNVFTNDGSFLQRFQRSKKEEEDKDKQDEIMNRKKNFENRFKNRGKRSRADATDETGSVSPPGMSPISPIDGDTDTNTPAKKTKLAAAPASKNMNLN